MVHQQRTTHKSSSEIATHALASGPTESIAEWVATRPMSPLPSAAKTWAKHALLDWIGVAIGGSHEPLIEILIDEALEDGSQGESRLLGRTERVAMTQAALINGAASHVLDYDDVHQRVYGHPSAAVAPAVLALAERHRSSGQEVIEAFVIGYEVACQIGDMIGPSHDEKGWHATATLGTFGATAGAAALLDLGVEQTTMALGIASTQAAGLQSAIGTMCKSLQVGRAAMNGLLAARWAIRGLTGNASALECYQGFGATQSTTFEAKPLLEAGDAFGVQSNLFKHHACCYLMHASIEATKALREQHSISADDVSQIHVRIPRAHLRACNIPEPRTGNQLKFSIRHVIAMVLAGLDTGDPGIYTPETATRSDLVRIRSKVQLEPEERDTSCYVAEVSMVLNNRQTVRKFVDVGLPEKDLERQGQRLERKFVRLAEPTIGRVPAEKMVALLSDLDELEDLQSLLALATSRR